MKRGITVLNALVLVVVLVGALIILNFIGDNITGAATQESCGADCYTVLNLRTVNFDDGWGLSLRQISRSFVVVNVRDATGDLVRDKRIRSGDTLSIKGYEITYLKGNKCIYTRCLSADLKIVGAGTTDVTPIRESKSSPDYRVMNDWAITTQPGCKYGLDNNFDSMKKGLITIQSGLTPTKSDWKYFIGNTQNELCFPGNGLIEYYCDSNGYPHYVTGFCSGVCKDGECVTTTTTPTTNVTITTAPQEKCNYCLLFIPFEMGNINLDPSESGIYSSTSAFKFQLFGNPVYAILATNIKEDSFTLEAYKLRGSIQGSYAKEGVVESFKKEVFRSDIRSDLGRFKLFDNVEVQIHNFSSNGVSISLTILMPSAQRPISVTLVGTSK